MNHSDDSASRIQQIRDFCIGSTIDRISNAEEKSFEKMPSVPSVPSAPSILRRYASFMMRRYPTAKEVASCSARSKRIDVSIEVSHPVMKPQPKYIL